MYWPVARCTVVDIVENNSFQGIYHEWNFFLPNWQTPLKFLRIMQEKKLGKWVLCLDIMFVFLFFTGKQDKM